MKPPYPGQVPEEAPAEEPGLLLEPGLLAFRAREAARYLRAMPDPRPKRPRGRPRLPPETQRQRLFDAAIAAIEKQGYEEVRVADIVREAGMSSRSFYQLFESKEDLVARYVEMAAAGLVTDLQRVWAEASDPLERIDRGVEAFLQVVPDIRVDLDAIRGEPGKRTRDARKLAVREVTRLIVDDLTRAHEAGRLERRPDPVMVEMILTGLESTSLRWFAEGRVSDLPRLRPALVTLLVRAGLLPKD